MPTTTLSEATIEHQAELNTVLDQPDTTQSWTSWIASISGTDDQSARPAPLPEGVIPKVTMEDFSRYLLNIGQKLADDDILDTTIQNEPSENLHKQEQTKNIAAAMTVAASKGGNSSTSLADAMKKVPLMFFQEDFSLGWTELWTHVGSIDTLDKQQEVLEQLSAQLDSIETYLIHEISARYESFFEASVFVHELKGNVNTLLTQVTEKRKVMDTLVEETKEHAENAVQLKRKRANMTAALKLATAAQQVIQAKSALQSSLLIAPEAGLDYMGTLNILDSLQETYHTHDSTDITAIHALPEYIHGVKKALKEIMTSDVLELTKFEVQAQVDGLLQLGRVMLQDERGDSEREAGGVDSIMPEQNARSAMLIQLGAPLTGLCRVGNIFDAVHSLHKELYLDISNFLTTLTGRYLDEICNIPGVDISDGLSSLPMTQSLKSIEGAQYSVLFKLVISATKLFISHCQAINDIMNDIFDQVITSMPDVSKNIPQRQALDCCIRAAHGAVGCWASLLSSWTEASSMGNFHLRDLCSILDLTDAFASSIEGHAGKSMGILRGHIQDACRATIDHMHSRHMKTLIDALEQEKWTYVSLDKDSQGIVKELESALEQQRSAQGTAAGDEDSPSQQGSEDGLSTEALLYINGKGFHTVRTVQVLLSVLKQYHAFCTAVPVLTADASQRVVELLRTFNSRTCQLILGAGAMQVSGLRSISVKHLAIACHSVRAMLALYPALQAVFVNPVLPLPRRNMIGDEYARTLQDMTTHIDEIRNKIATILCDRLNNAPDLLSLLGSIPPTSTVGHDAAAESGVVGTIAPSSFASSTAKQLHILVDIMVSTSLAEDTSIVLKRVGQRYSIALAAAYGTTNLESAGIDAQLTADLTLLIESIEKLPLESVTLRGYVQELKVLQAKYQQAAERNVVLLPPSPPQSPPPHQTQHAERESSSSPNIEEVVSLDEEDQKHGNEGVDDIHGDEEMLNEVPLGYINDDTPIDGDTTIIVESKNVNDRSGDTDAGHLQ